MHLELTCSLQWDLWKNYIDVVVAYIGVTITADTIGDHKDDMTVVGGGIAAADY